jgi:enolase
VRLGASLSDARRVAQEAASTVPQGDELAIYVQIGAVTETTAWLHVVAYAPFGADVSHVASEIREQTVAALASADLLPV